MLLVHPTRNSGGVSIAGQPEDKRASVSSLLKATSQHSRLQRAKMWQPTGSSYLWRAQFNPGSVSHIGSGSSAELCIRGPVATSNQDEMSSFRRISRWQQRSGGSLHASQLLSSSPLPVTDDESGPQWSLKLPINSQCSGFHEPLRLTARVSEASRK